jgi:hypothetical protein
MERAGKEFFKRLMNMSAHNLQIAGLKAKSPQDALYLTYPFTKRVMLSLICSYRQATYGVEERLLCLGGSTSE